MAKADAKAGDVIVYAAHTPNGVPIPAVTHATVKAPSIPSGTYSYFLKFKHTGYVRNRYHQKISYVNVIKLHINLSDDRDNHRDSKSRLITVGAAWDDFSGRESLAPCLELGGGVEYA